jgi:hypothetical protein
VTHAVLYTDAVPYPLDPSASNAATLPFGYYVFYLAGTTTPATVWQDSGLATPYVGNPTANSKGLFNPIYLNPGVAYRVLMYDQYNRKLLDVDPYIPFLTTLGDSAVTMNQSTGQTTITQLLPGGSGAALTVLAPMASFALLLGPISNTAYMNISNSGTTGSQTATFTATNKPGSATSAPFAWVPIQMGGTLYYMPVFS